MTDDRPSARPSPPISEASAPGRLEDKALAQLFFDARTHTSWRDAPVSNALLDELAKLMNLGPTSMNCEPARLRFVIDADDKKRLDPLLSPGNRPKVATAPVTAIVAYDLQFHEKMGELFPYAEGVGARFAANPENARLTAFRNGCLQAGYFILAARALGLDVGPMSGFDNAAVDAEFFPGGRFASNILCNLGYGDGANMRPERPPRLAVEDTLLK